MADNDDDKYQSIIIRPIKLLGKGVSGHVFVVDDHTVVKVALRSSNPWLDDAALQDHLIEQAIYERLGRHNRICELKDVIDRGLVLERLKQCLRERLLDLQGRNMTPSHEEALKWSIQVAQGAAYIHDRGVYQSDMGCHNLLLDEEENIKLCDFGGSSIDGSKPLCGAGTGFQRPTEDTDIISVVDELFALGSTIYEIWTTKKPHQNEGDCYDTVLRKFKNQQFPDLTGIPPANVITKCWLGRYKSATEVVIDLEALQGNTQAHSGSHEKSDSVIQSSASFPHDHRIALLSSATLAIVLIAVVLHCKITSYSRFYQA